MTHSRKLVIAFVIDSLSTKDGISGGTEKQLLQMLSQIDKEIFKPLLFCLRKYKNDHVFESVCVEKYYLNIYSLKSISSYLSMMKFAALLKDRSVDIVHTYFFDSTFVGVLSAKLAGIRTIISSRRDLGFWYNNKLLRWLKFLNMFTDRFLVNSISVKNELIKKEKVNYDSIHVIYNGINFSDIEGAGTADILREFGLQCFFDRFKIVGIVGNFNRKVKRIDLFIQAAAQVLKEYENVFFLIVGAGSYGNELKTLACDLGIEDRVVFTGYKSDVIPYIRNFTIGVNTSDSEGFSNTILEYMAAGIPVVATNVSGNAELVQDGITGILVPPENPGEIAHAICELLRDENRCRRMGIESKKIVEDKYSWDSKIKEIENYYLSVANRR